MYVILMNYRFIKNFSYDFKSKSEKNPILKKFELCIQRYARVAKHFQLTDKYPALPIYVVKSASSFPFKINKRIR